MSTRSLQHVPGQSSGTLPYVTVLFSSSFLSLGFVIGDAA